MRGTRLDGCRVEGDEGGEGGGVERKDLGDVNEKSYLASAARGGIDVEW